MLHAVIMAGGGGTRFWPRSRQRRLSVIGRAGIVPERLFRLGKAPFRGLQKPWQRGRSAEDSRHLQESAAIKS